MEHQTSITWHHITLISCALFRQKRWRSHNGWLFLRYLAWMYGLLFWSSTVCAASFGFYWNALTFFNRKHDLKKIFCTKRESTEEMFLWSLRSFLLKVLKRITIEGIETISLFPCRDTLRKSKKHENARQRTRFTRIFLETWLILLSGPSIHLPTRWRERVFMATCLCSSLVFSGSFQVS